MRVAGGFENDRLTPPNPEITKELIDSYETQFLDFMSRANIQDGRFLSKDEMCHRISGYNLWTRNVGYWFDSQLRIWVGGLTTCWLGRVEVGSRDSNGFHYPISPGAYAHEMSHVVQSCDSTPPVDMYADGQHANWFRDGIYKAIDGLGKQLIEEREGM